MNKIILSSTIIILLMSYGFTQKDCRCEQVSDQETAIWVFDTIQIINRQPIKRIYGKVTDSSGAAVPGSLVEIYPVASNNKNETTKNKESEIERIAACRPMQDGSFCFTGIKPGKYNVVCTAKDFRRTIVTVVLNPNSSKSSNEPLAVELQVGL
jgi:hypothetical protein